MHRGVDATLVNIKEDGRRDGPGKWDRTASVEVLNKRERESWSWGHNKKRLSVNLSQRSDLESSKFKKSSTSDPMNRLAEVGAIYGCALNLKVIE